MDQGEPSFTQVDLSLHRAALIDLNLEYANWAAEEMGRMFDLTVEDMVGTDIVKAVDDRLKVEVGDLAVKLSLPSNSSATH